MDCDGSFFACLFRFVPYTPVALLIVGNGPAAAKTAMRGPAVSCRPFCGHFVGCSGLDLITAVPFSVGRSLLMRGGVFARPLALLQDLVKRITQCAERFAPSNSWYVGVITKVFRLAGDMVKPEVAHNLMQLIAEGSGEDEEADVALRRDAVDSYLDLLETPAVPDQVRVSACVVACAGFLFLFVSRLGFSVPGVWMYVPVLCCRVGRPRCMRIYPKPNSALPPRTRCVQHRHS